MDGPFGALMANSEPSRPHQALQTYFLALGTTHKSSGAHLAIVSNLSVRPCNGPSRTSPLKKHLSYSAKRACPRKDFRREGKSLRRAESVARFAGNVQTRSWARCARDRLLRFRATCGGLFARPNYLPPGGRSYDAAPVSHYYSSVS